MPMYGLTCEETPSLFFFSDQSYPGIMPGKVQGCCHDPYVRIGHFPDNLTICVKAERQCLQRLMAMKANEPERMGMLDDAIRLLVSENMQICQKAPVHFHTVPGTWEFNRRLRFVRFQHKRPVISLRPGWCWELLQKLESVISSCQSETSQESSFNYETHTIQRYQQWFTRLHLPPSRLRDSLLLADRVKRGAGRSIMELAWRVWAWVRPLYRNFEPKTRKRRDEGGSTVETLRDRYSYLIFIHPAFNQFDNFIKVTFTYQRFKYKWYSIVSQDFVFPANWHCYVTRLARGLTFILQGRGQDHGYAAFPLWLNCHRANIGIKPQRPVSQLSRG